MDLITPSKVQIQQQVDFWSLLCNLFIDEVVPTARICRYITECQGNKKAECQLTVHNLQKAISF